jgi:aryl-alcohol dehydrogenase-like predicted oxidoreductase
MIAHRELGRTGLRLSAIGYGGFKIGRNQGIKYPRGYDLPDARTVGILLNSLVDLGVTYIDTAPAYGSSEERIGATLHHRRHELVISTKVGETFARGRSTYDFSPPFIRRSLETSLNRLRTDAVDILFIHSDGRDLAIIRETEAVPTLQRLRRDGLVRAIGFSGKTVAGARAALDWADAIMVTYHAEDRSHEAVIEEAARRGVGVVVKKGLGSGQLPADAALRFLLGTSPVASAMASVVVGSLSLEHMARNVSIAQEVDGEGTKARRHEGTK